MFHDNLTKALKNYLREKGIEEKKVNEYFIILTQSTKKSLIQIEREEFLEIALKIKNDPYHKELFEKLYKNFTEQEIGKYGYKTHTKEYEEMLELKSSEIISKIKPEIFRLIKQHYEKYFYVNHM